MNRWLSQLTLMIVLSTLLGCSGGGSALLPDSRPAAPSPTGASTNQSPHSHLWGIYDVYIDVSTQTASAVASRGAMFTANVVNFINGKPANLKFKINGTLVTSTHVDVDIDVGITHPFPGLSQYNGYDVRGIFMGNGSLSMKYNSDLKYTAFGSEDQVMYDYNAVSGDPHPGLIGMPDGYTRWYNKAEFPTSGMFGYTKGLFATSGFNPTATLNPYKYFADNLPVTADAWTFLTTTTGNGVFSAGATNTRNYYLRFPNSGGGVKFAYAIIANWQGTLPSDHPSNAPEACVLKTTITPGLFYESTDVKGGKLILDMSFPNKWGSQPSKIFIESTVLLNPYQLSSSEMIPSSGTGYLTYHVEITPDNLVKKDGNEVWVIAQYDDFDYTNSFGVPNSAGADKLAACFRYDLPVTGVYNCSGLQLNYNSAYELDATATQWDDIDDEVITVSLGFTFSFGGADYTHVNISSNGGVNFDYDDDWYDDCSFDWEERAIWLVGDDLTAYPEDSDWIRYQKKTIAGKEAFIIDWNTHDYDYDDTFGDGKNRFQLILFNSPNTTYDSFLMQWKSVFEDEDDDESASWFHYMKGSEWNMCCVYELLNTMTVPNALLFEP